MYIILNNSPAKSSRSVRFGCKSVNFAGFLPIGKMRGCKMRLIDAKTLGEIVRKQRKRQGATQTQVAALANTGLRFISDLENGKPTVQLGKALRVAKVLGIHIEALDMDGDDK
jgi:y4mF family transcriptional regulator